MDNYLNAASKEVTYDTIDGSPAPLYLERMPCGGRPVFDHTSGYAYRCDACFAVIGSIGMPTECKNALQREIDERKFMEKLSK